MNSFILKNLVWLTFAIALTACGGGGGSSPKGPSNGGGAPTLSDLTGEVNHQTGSVNWRWSCPDSLAEGQACKFRYAITQSPSHSFSAQDAYEPATSQDMTVPFDAAHSSFVSDGAYYIHIQYQVVNASSGSVVSTSRITTSEEAVLDFSNPSVTGLTPDTTAARFKSWTWGCSESNCEYRFVVNQQSAAPNPMTGSWGSDTTATQSTGDGTYYLHVQARDAAQKLSPVLSVPAILDNTNPVVTGLQNDNITTRSKVWNWDCQDESPCTYRFAINRSATHTFSSESYATPSTATKASVDGTYYLHVQARDQAGNESVVKSVSAVLSTTVLGVTGISSDLAPVKSKTWTWGCSISSGCAYRFAINQSANHSFSNEAFGATSTATQSTGDGTYYLHVQARQGNRNSAVLSVAAVLDNSAPSVTGLSDDTTPTRSFTWTWSCSDATECTYRHIINQSSTHTFNSEAFAATATATQASGDGPYYVHIQARDQAGNEGAVASASAVLDNTAPDVIGLSLDSVPRTTKTWTWGCREPSCTYRYLINTNPSHSFSNESFSSTATASKTGVDGTYYIHVQARDQAGNLSSVMSVSAVLSTTILRVTGISSDSTPTKSKTWNWGCDNDNNSQNTPPPCTYRFAINQSASHSFGVGDAFGNVTTASKITGDGTYYLHVQTRSGSENSAVMSVSVILDNTGPTVTGIADGDTGFSQPVRSVTWNWGCSDAIGCEYRFVVNVNSSHVFAQADAYGSTTSHTHSSGDGIYYLHVQARDALGNEGSVKTVASSRVDNTAPSISGLTQDNTATRSKTWTWTSNDGRAVFRHVINQNPTHSFGAGDAYGSVKTASQTSGSGTYYLHVQARDRAGNESEVTSVSAILDNEGPSVTGLTNDNVAKPSKTWTWSCSDATGCEYRFVISQNTDQSSNPLSGLTWGSVSTATKEGVTRAGTWYLHVQARDALGNEGPAIWFSAELNVALGATGLSSDITPTQSKTWTWGCNKSNCTYRFAVNQSSSHSFSNESFNSTATASKTSGDGTYYLHVQVQSGSETSAVISVSAVLDNTAPSVTGLQNDNTSAQSKSWTWGCSESCTFRHQINALTNHTFGSSDSYNSTTSATQSTGDAIYYVHVQARDQAGNESAVAKASVRIDNTAPTVEDLVDDSTPTKSKTWTWDCSEVRGCKYRFAINQNTSHSFGSATYGNVVSAATATQSTGDGTHYLHVQAQDEAGNESAVRRVSAVLDNTAPSVTGLTNDSTATASKSWSWGCSEVGCTYRFVINQNSSHSFSSGAFATTNTASTPSNSADGTYYLHVQARDRVALVSPVVSVSAVLQNVLSVTGLVGDTNPTRSKTWTWGCNKSSCTYRHAINQNSTHSFGAGDAFGNVTTASKTSGDGTWYVHVQAQSGTENSAVLSVSAILDNTGPTVTGLSTEVEEARSFTWTWGCSDEPARSCTYRHVAGSGSFDSAQALGGLSYNNIKTATRENVHEFKLFHVQARDHLGNEGPPFRFFYSIDTRGPSVTGLSNDSTPTNSKTWTWSCSDAIDATCTFRFAINQNSTHSFADTDSWSAIKTATQNTGSGTWYIHVQARDYLENEGAVTSVSAILNNAAGTSLEDCDLLENQEEALNCLEEQLQQLPQEGL